ncbi:nickel insertion protein [Eubacterium sp. 1001713B170207_170306_E7]|uniref:nickel insertion protein n=1 Tax=Eubacterium sp. 1001713B170207_170306_E7 TaxID=2787097 RepID=UPI001FAD3BAF
MEIHSKNGLVFMVQVDHLTGECVGQAIDRLYGAGAANVQVVSAITKKNRPSYVFFIDCCPASGDAVEAVIAGELTSGGWHKLSTEHRYQYNDKLKRPVVIEHGGERLSFSVEGKRFESGSLRPEHDSVMALREAVYEKWQKPVTYDAAYHIAFSVLRDEENSVHHL